MKSLTFYLDEYDELYDHKEFENIYIDYFSIDASIEIMHFFQRPSAEAFSLSCGVEIKWI